MRSAPEAKVYPISWNLSVGAAAARNVHVLQSGEKKQTLCVPFFLIPPPRVCERSREMIVFVISHATSLNLKSFVLFFCVTFVLSCHLLLWSVCRRDVGELSHG